LRRLQLAERNEALAAMPASSAAMQII